MAIRNLVSVAIGFSAVVFFVSGVTPESTRPLHEKIVTARTLEENILIIINEHRQKKNLPALKMKTEISQEAEKHSRTMARKNKLSHNGLSARMKSISAKMNDVAKIAENVAFGFTTARAVVDNWLNSSGHRSNIEGHYNLTGIGIATDKKGQIYFTQIFVLAK